MRATVGTIVGLIASGVLIDDLIAEYPCLEREDIMAVLSHAAWRSEEREIEIAAG
jgi:uncharacterized protein (DUF433 family)